MAKYKHQGIVHRIAHCEDCDWINADYNYALQSAKRHSEKTGHKVNIETGTWGIME